MSVTTLWDHLAVIGFALLLPAYVRYTSYPRFRDALADGVPDARTRQYVVTMVRQWVLAITVLSLWHALGRPLAALGLSRPAGLGFWTTFATAVATALVWRSQVRAALREDAARRRLLEQLEAVSPILPASRRELRLFTALSLTAGICEEILFRGYLIWYLGLYLGTAPAIVLAGSVFGLGHLYQGASQTLKIAVVGIVLGVFYVGSGSLWVPMALHAALDASQGRLAYRLRCASSTFPG